MKNTQPFISIIIPSRNEEKYIGKCLETILEQDYLHLRQGFGGQAKENLEVLIIDGMSEDKTREIIKKFQITNSNSQFDYWIILKNLPILLLI